MSAHPRPSAVVIGGANVDVVAISVGTLQPRVSAPGRIRISAGGAGRNVAENLARLGIATRLITTIDESPLGEWLLAQTARAGVDTTGVLRTPGSGSYYVAVEAAGVVEWAVSDMAAAEALSPAHLDAHASEIRAAGVVVIDANLLPAAITRAVELTAGRAVCLLPVSVAKAHRMRAVLSRASLIVLTAAEGAVFTKREIQSEEEAMRAAESLRALAGATVVITMADRGIVWVSDDSLWLPASPTNVVDSSGAGDAVAAIAVYSLLAGLNTRTAAPLALAAGAMTVSVEGPTHPGLSLDALHAHR